MPSKTNQHPDIPERSQFYEQAYLVSRGTRPLSVVRESRDPAIMPEVKKILKEIAESFEDDPLANNPALPF